MDQHYSYTDCTERRLKSYTCKEKRQQKQGGQNVRDVMLLESRFYFMLENVIGARYVNMKEKNQGENKIGNLCKKEREEILHTTMYDMKENQTK